MALVTTDFLLVRPGFAGQTAEALQPIINDASALVVLECSPNLDDATPDDCPAAIQAVVAAMCLRGSSNPRGATQETLGDYSYSMASDGGVATLYLTRREVKIVRKASATLGATTLALAGYLPVQRSELITAAASADVWDTVTAGIGD